MISDKQKLILKLLLKNSKGLNINQIARTLHISLGWVHQSLKFLESESLLKSSKIKNSVLYSVNWHNPKAVKLLEFILVEELESKKPTHDAIFESLEMQKSSYNIITKDVAMIIEKEIIESNPGEERKDELNPTNVYIGYSKPDTNSAIYNVANVSNPAAPNTDNPYRQAAGPISSLYNVTPVGDQGISSVLGMYGSGGVPAGGSAYASASPTAGNYGSTGAASPGTIESAVSSLIGRYTFAQHTSHLLSGSVTSCRYCGTV